MDMLVGYTGFVGSNLCGSHKFDGLYDSKNIQTSYLKNPDLLVYSGVPAQKFIANNEPEKDFKIIENAIYNIKQINPKEIVLISTIDVYKKPVNVNEDTKIDTKDLQPYGKNRYYLEKWVKNNIKNHLIIHLPGLYGKNIKKNFIYDLIKIIPSMLAQEKYEELENENIELKKYYIKQDNGFYKLKELNKQEELLLKNIFNNIGFNALNFTDSRGKFQFYNLKFLWEHIEIARKNKLETLNVATEPVKISEIYEYIKNDKFVNEITNNIPDYNFRTKFDYLFNGKNGYIFNKEFILEDIKKFVTQENSI